MDLNNVQAGVQELKITSTSRFEADTFVPHGISVWEDKTAGKCKAAMCNCEQFSTAQSICVQLDLLTGVCGVILHQVIVL